MGVPAGPWYIDDTLTFTVNTHDVATGAATDADAVPAYRVYEDETGTAILNGNMAKLDDANTTGFYSEQLTLSAANGFEAGKSYSIYVAATVDSIAATQSFNFKVIAAPHTLAAINAEVDTAISDAALATATDLGTVDTVVDAIKVQTDKMVFTVANQIDSNVKSVNQVTVDGVGSEADPWGPA